MPLRATVTASPETLSEMLLAAEDRYREAEDLLVSHQFDGCVYLLGYCVEMWMKAACLRLKAAGPSVPVKAVLSTLKPLLPFIGPVGLVRFDYHDVSLLAGCIIFLRQQAGRPLPANVLTDLHTHVSNGTHLEWIVDMRYRRSGLRAAEAWSALQHAWWARNNWALLT